MNSFLLAFFQSRLFIYIIAGVSVLVFILVCFCISCTLCACGVSCKSLKGVKNCFKCLCGLFGEFDLSDFGGEDA